MVMMTFRSSGSGNIYETAYRLIAPLERKYTSDDLVPRDVGDGHLTIGAGCNLDGGHPTVKWAVYKALGIQVDPNTGRVFTNNGTPVQLAAEMGYINNLNQALFHHGWSPAQKVAELNRVMALRSADSTLNGYANNRVASFAFSSEQQIHDSFVDGIKAYENDLQIKLNATDPSIVTRPNFADSWEHTAILQLKGSASNIFLRNNHAPSPTH